MEKPSQSSLDHPLRARLPDYATLLIFGAPPLPDRAEVAAHVAACAECRSALDQLLAAMYDALSADLAPAPAYPRPNLAFLRPAGLPWYVAQRRLVICFSEAMLGAFAAQSAAGASRGALLYRYVQEPRSVGDLEVSIDVYAEEGQPGQGRVRVSVEIPSRDPFQQHGSQVIVRADQESWEGVTDDLGLAVLGPVPLAALPRLRVEIVPAE